ncbi:MAG: alpha/beta fold hydrolase [Nitrospinota bacterium]
MPKARVGESVHRTVELYYEVHGPEGAQEWVFLVTGLSGLASAWEKQLPAFAERYRVVVHDHRGTGQSEKPESPYSVELQAGDLAGLMDHLGVDRAHIVGSSTGGAMGMALALDRPERVRSLALVSTWPGPDFHFRRLFEVRRRILRHMGAQDYIRASTLWLYPPEYLNGHAREVEEMERRQLQSFPPPRVADLRLQMVLAFDRREELGRIAAPTLVLVAKDDILTPPHFSREIAQKIPGAELLVMEGGGHSIHRVNPEGFNRAVLDFLARHGDREE